MNYNPLSRRPLSEAIRKHGSSKMFLWAIILSFASIVLTPIAFAADFSNSLKELGEIFDTQFSSDEIIGAAVIMLFVWIIVSVPVILMNIGLLRGYRYFSGKTLNPNGFDFYLTVYRVVLIVAGALIAIPFGIGVLGTVLSIFIGGMPFAETLTALFFVLPIFAGIFVGMGFLYVATYKAIKKTMDYAMCAAVDIHNGGVSVFLIVISIIGVASNASSILQLISGITPELIIEGESIATSSFSVIATIPNLISGIFYLILLFKFKADMNAAKNEWDWIQRQKAAIELANAKAAEAARLQAEQAKADELSAQEVEHAEGDADIGECENHSPAVAEKAQPIESNEAKPQDDGNGDISDSDVFVD